MADWLNAFNTLPPIRGDPVSSKLMGAKQLFPECHNKHLVQPEDMELYVSISTNRRRCSGQKEYLQAAHSTTQEMQT